MIKLAVLLQRKSGMSFEAFDRYWDGPHGDLVLGIPEFMRHVRRYSQSHLVDPSYEGAGMAWQRAAIDGIAEVWFDDLGAMTAAFNESRFVELVGPDDARFIDGSAVSILVTQEIEKIPLNGSPAVKLAVAIKRPDGMSFDDFDNYWNTTHAKIVTSTLTNRWHFAPFEGIAELWFDDTAEVVRAFNEPAFIDKIAPDDENFVDQAGTKLIVVQEIDKFPALVHRYTG